MQQPELKSIEPIITGLPAPLYLDNGVEVNVIPLEMCEIVAVTIMFTGGEWVQDKKLQSDFAMRQIRSGAGDYNSEVITEKLDFYGATLTAGAALTYSYIQISALKRTLPDVLPLLRDIVLYPKYDSEQFALGIQEGIFANNVSMQRVAEVCKRMFYKNLLGKDNPAAQFPDDDDYKNLTRDDLIRYHKECIRLDNAVMYVTGKVDDGVLGLVNKYFGNMHFSHANNGICLKRADIATQINKSVSAEIAVPSVQSGLRVGKVLPDFTHPDYPGILFFGSVLGGYFGSRLMANIREKLGLTYGIGSTFYNIPESTIFITATETPRESVERCVEEVKKDIIDLQRKPIDSEEMALAKNYVLGQFCRMTETSYSLSTVMMTKRVYGQTLEDWLSEQKKIQALTAEDLMRVAQEHFDVDSMLVACAHGKTLV